MKRDEVSASNYAVPSANSDGRSNVTLMFAVLDTTWRMFIPSTGFMMLGVWLDGQYGVKPWYTVAGTLFGLLCSVLLVKKQLREIMSRANNKEPRI